MFIPQIFQNRKRQNQKSRHIQHFESRTRDRHSKWDIFIWNRHFKIRMDHFYSKIGHFIPRKSRFYSKMTATLTKSRIWVSDTWSTFEMRYFHFKMGLFISKSVILFRFLSIYTLKFSNFSRNRSFFLRKSWFYSKMEVALNKIGSFYPEWIIDTSFSDSVCDL